MGLGSRPRLDRPSWHRWESLSCLVVVLLAVLQVEVPVEDDEGGGDRRWR